MLAGMKLQTAIVGLMILLAFYFLSIGPVLWLESCGYLNLDEGVGVPIAYFYLPLEYVYDTVPVAAQVLDWYIDLW